MFTYILLCVCDVNSAPKIQHSCAVHNWKLVFGGSAFRQESGKTRESLAKLVAETVLGGKSGFGNVAEQA